MELAWCCMGRGSGRGGARLASRSNKKALVGGDQNYGPFRCPKQKGRFYNRDQNRPLIFIYFDQLPCRIIWCLSGYLASVLLPTCTGHTALRNCRRSSRRHRLATDALATLGCWLFGHGNHCMLREKETEAVGSLQCVLSNSVWGITRLPRIFVTSTTATPR